MTLVTFAHRYVKSNQGGSGAHVVGGKGRGGLCPGGEEGSKEYPHQRGVSHLGNKEAFGAGLYALYQAIETLESRKNPPW